jgi:hypothetical protein
VIGYDHGGVSEQLNKLLPEGAVKVGYQAQLLEVTKRWLILAPKVNANEVFTLQSMLDKTYDVYCELVQAK